jgi:SAM-dependent methyltransferase
MIIPYWLMYRLGFTPWERRPIPEYFQRFIEGPDRLPPGRALDIGCGTGADAVYLAKHGWRVTAVDLVGRALERAKARAARERVDVQWVAGDVGTLGDLGLEPGYTLLYDFGCMQGLPDAARAGAAAGVTKLAALHASLLIVAFSRSQRFVLPRGMDKSDIEGLFGRDWQFARVESLIYADMPAPVRRARPTLYHLARGLRGAESGSTLTDRR